MATGTSDETAQLIATGCDLDPATVRDLLESDDPIVKRQLALVRASLESRPAFAASMERFRRRVCA